MEIYSGKVPCYFKLMQPAQAKHRSINDRHQEQKQITETTMAVGEDGQAL